MSEGGEIAAGPDRSLRGDERMDAAVQHLDQQLERLETHAREAARQHVRAQQHERARLRLAERCADAGRMRAKQVQLQLAQAVERNPDVGEAAEAGRDAVDDGAASDGVVDHLPRGQTTRRAGSDTTTRRPVARHGLELVEADTGSVDRESGLRMGRRAHRRGGTRGSLAPLAALNSHWRPQRRLRRKVFPHRQPTVPSRPRFTRQILTR